MMTFWKALLKNKASITPLLIATFLFGAVLQACNGFISESPEEDKNPVARVKDKFLYEEDLKKIYNKNENQSLKDSLAFRKQLIDNWITEQLIFQKALKNLPEKEKDKEEELQDYYRSLIRYEYEQALINEKIDTSFSNDTIREFYKRHKDRFTLNTPVIKFRYIIVPKDAPKKDRIKTWFQEEDNKYLDSLYFYARRYAKNFDFKDNQWYYYKNVRKKLSLPEQNNSQLLDKIKRKQVLESKGQALTYLIYITDFKGKNDKAPVSLKKEAIKKMMLNRKKIDLIQEMENKVFQKGLEKNNVKRYD